MAKKEINKIEALKDLIESNRKNEIFRQEFIDSFGNADVFCNEIKEAIGVDMFNAVMKISSEIGDDELLSNKLSLRAFIDKEINIVNDALQNKTFDLIKTAYLPYRTAFSQKSITDENTIDLMLDVEKNIDKFVHLDCQILSTYLRLPYKKIVDKLNDPSINKKYVLREVKKMVNNGIGVTRKANDRALALKDIEVGVYNLNKSKTMTR